MILKGYHCEVISFPGSDALNLFPRALVCSRKHVSSLERTLRLFTIMDQYPQFLLGLGNNPLHCTRSGTFHCYFQYPLFEKKIHLNQLCLTNQ